MTPRCSGEASLSAAWLAVEAKAVRGVDWLAVATAGATK